MAEMVSGNELAKRLGVSETAVRKHVKRGLYRPNKSGLFDVEACMTSWRLNRDPEAVARGIDGAAAVSKNAAPMAHQIAGENSLTRARTVQATLKVQREHLALQREKGELIKTEDAYKACRAVVSLVTERLDGAAAQIAPRVVGLDAVKAERVIREILASIRTELAAMAGAIEVVADATKT